MQHREAVKVEIQPDEEQESRGAIRRFKIQRVTTKESRRNDREIWKLDSSQPDYVTFEDVVTGMTRNQLAKFVADAADWLSYIEEN